MSSFRMFPHKRNDVLRLYMDRALIFTNPVYQRISGVWEPRKRQLFIDSILNGFDIPKLYFHELLPAREIEGRKFSYAIIDGKQRLEAIWEFMDNRFALAGDFRVFNDPSMRAEGLTYSDLGSRFPFLRAQFDRTELPIVVMQTSDEELVENLFARLNEAVPLTAPEYRNTLGGPMPRLIRELGAHRFFQTNLPFETGRHRYLDLAAKFAYISSLDRFVSTKKSDLDTFVRRFKRLREQGSEDASPQRVDALQREVHRVLEKMADTFREKDQLLSLIGMVTLYYHAFRMMDGGLQPDPEKLRNGLMAFETELREHRRKARAAASGRSVGRLDPKFVSFERSRQATNDGSAILARYRIIRDYLLNRTGIGLPSPASD